MARTSPDGAPATLPTVAVVVPTRGRPDLVRETVASIVGQDYTGAIDVIVVHDHEEPQEGLRDLAVDGRTVELIPNTHPQGLSGSRNSGLDRVSADYVASCDDDDFWDPPKIRLQIDRMLADPGLLVVGTGIRLLMSEDRVVEWPGDSPVVTRAQLLRSRRKELHSSSMLMRREVFDRVGRYDEELPGSYGEDYEFLLRAVTAGRIGVVNQPLASIRKYTPSHFRERAELIVEALEYLLAKHPEIAESRAGHARLLGTIAFAQSTMGRRREALRQSGRALARWPLAPFGWLTVVQATTRVDPLTLLAMTRRLGRGIT